ncbi:cytochrome b [Mesorhizobium sp. LHD-90]|uniref:cytochrome b n=1 Tax=Mesorhizobium sp. LHD-90 TaxID=3071414 RepID=UPI0027E00B30|nr:cytochrome b [Mesorhizobium sp. LHD-90]MDQ6433323.1 cytochrome b [Mesorhizobium sp. LHD-90]
MPRYHENTYGIVAIALHWTIALLFLGQIVFGFSMEQVKSLALQFELIQWHKSFGFLILILAFLRLLWRLAAGRPQPPATLSRVERVAAETVQWTLLIATLAVPLAGWALASTSTLGIPSFAFNLVVVPHLPLTPSDEAEAFWRETHKLLAYGAGMLAIGHAAAALAHHFVLRDDVLVRMLPGRAARPATHRVTLETNDDV